MATNIQSDLVVTTTHSNKTVKSSGKFESKANRSLLVYGFALLVVIAAILVSYVILRDSIATQKKLTQYHTHIHNAQLAITDTSSLLSDYRLESKKDNPNTRLMQLIAQRTRESVEKLDSIEDSIQTSVDEIKGTNLWSEVSWIGESGDDSLNHKLNSYAGQIRNVFETSDTSESLSPPPIPIEAAGARNGALFLGFKAASEKITEQVEKNAAKVEKAHIALTSFIMTVLLLISALIVVPLWKRLVSEHRRLESAHKKLFNIAYTDRQTDLPNLHGLEKSLSSLPGFDSEETNYSLFLVRIRNLDQLYNLIGSQSVDSLLQTFCAKLNEFDGITSSWCRSGEPEFCCLLPDEYIQSADLWASKLHGFLTEPLTIDGIIVRTELSFSSSCIDNADQTATGLLSQHLGNARLASDEFNPPELWLPQYHPDMNNVLIDQNNLIERIAEGLTNNEFVPFYQLKVDAQTGDFSSMEVLTRWNIEDNNLRFPSVFIPVAESSGLIVDMTFRIFEQVAKDIQHWCDKDIPVGRVAINIARDVLLHDELLPRLQNMLDQLPNTCEGLEIEITENIAIEDNFERTCSILSDVRNMGVHVSIDDFGTGYASLQTLIDLPFDVLKIDRAFVIPMTESGTGNEVVSAMISLSNTLEKTCVIEGVETEWQWRSLAAMGANELQGFHFHRPSTADEIEHTLNNDQSRRSAA